MDKISIKINGKEVSATPGSTILQAARENDIYIPTLCHFDGLDPKANCRICVVAVEGMRGLQPSCATKIRENMVIYTDTEEIRNVRKSILELILANHAVDCHHCLRIGSTKCDDLDPVFCEMCFWCDCPRDGFCELQALAREYHVDVLPYAIQANKYETDTSLGSVIRNPNKCIKCQRCVDVCGEVQTVHNLSVANRGTETMIVPSLGKSMAESACVRCGRCASVCPTGAIIMQEHIDEILYHTHKYGITTVAQLDAQIIPELETYYKLAPGSISVQQVAAALHKIGVDYVVSDQFAKKESMEAAAKALEHATAPVAISDSYAVKNFVEQNFDDMKGRICFYDSPQKIFGEYIKTVFAKEKGLDPEQIRTIVITVSNEACAEAKETGSVDYAVNARELYRILLRTGGAPHRKNGVELDVLGGCTGDALPEKGGFVLHGEVTHREMVIADKTVKVAEAKNLGQTRFLLEQMRAGSCTADVLWLNA